MLDKELGVVKTMMEIAVKMDIDTKLKIEMCEKNIKWAQTSKLVFLSQRLQVQLAYLLYLVCK